MLLPLAALLLASCQEETKSYSELLKDEERAVNWFMAQQKINLQVPTDTLPSGIKNFKTGSDAPFYKMDEDGSVYMQVIRLGDQTSRPKKGDRVYFRFMRQNILTYFDSGKAPAWEGNSESMGPSMGSTSLVYGNEYLTSTTQYGEGLQLPLDYLGYECEVNILVKSTMGMTDDITNCVPYLYNIRYFKAEY